MAGKKLQRASVEIVKYFGDTPAVRSFIDYTKRVALPGFDNMPIYYVADFSFFLAVFPATIFLFSLIPYIPIKNFQNELLNIIEGVLPSAAFASARTTITDIVKIQHSGLLSIGFLTALYFTTNGFMTMMRGFNSSYHASETRSPFRQRMVAIVLTFIL